MLNNMHSSRIYEWLVEWLPTFACMLNTGTSAVSADVCPQLHVIFCFNFTYQLRGCISCITCLCFVFHRYVVVVWSSSFTTFTDMGLISVHRYKYHHNILVEWYCISAAGLQIFISHPAKNKFFFILTKMEVCKNQVWYHLLRFPLAGYDDC